MDRALIEGILIPDIVISFYSFDPLLGKGDTARREHHDADIERSKRSAWVLKTFLIVRVEQAVTGSEDVSICELLEVPKRVAHPHCVYIRDDYRQAHLCEQLHKLDFLAPLHLP